jgi:hypothetical protein
MIRTPEKKEMAKEHVFLFGIIDVVRTGFHLLPRTKPKNKIVFTEVIGC